MEFSGLRTGTPADLAQVVAATLGIRDDAPAPCRAPAPPRPPCRTASPPPCATAAPCSSWTTANTSWTPPPNSPSCSCARPRAPGPGHRAGAARPGGRGGVPGGAAATGRRGTDVHGARRRGHPRLPARPGGAGRARAPGGRRDLPPPGRHPARAGAGRDPRTGSGCTGVGGAAARPVPGADLRAAGRPGPPADAAGGDRLELGAAQRPRTHRPAPSRRPHRRLRPGRRRGGLRGDGVARDEVLDLVTRLVDRSLVVVADGPTGPRYRLLESVAAYATERLHEMEDLTAVRDRHLLHYRALAEHAEPELRGAGQRPWLARLDAEAGNLRTALDEAVRRAAPGATTAGTKAKARTRAGPRAKEVCQVSHQGSCLRRMPEVNAAQPHPPSRPPPHPPRTGARPRTTPPVLTSARTGGASPRSGWARPPGGTGRAARRASPRASARPRRSTARPPRAACRRGRRRGTPGRW